METTSAVVNSVFKRMRFSVVFRMICLWKSLVESGIGHAVGGEGGGAVTAGGAFATRTFATFIAAPCQMIWSLQFQPAGDDRRLVELCKWRDKMNMVISADGNRLPDVFQKRNTAIRIGVARRIIHMSSEIEVAIVVFIDALRKTCRCGEHQAVTEWNVCSDFATIFRNLLTIGGVADFLRRAIKQRTVGETEDG